MDWLSRLQPLLMFASAAAGVTLMAINLRKARTIEDTPTAKIRSAAQGYLSINGTARAIDNETVIGPLTGRPCLWYRYTIERRDNDDDGTRWTTIERGTSEKLFALDDATGVCHIDPHRAEVTTAITQTWQGNERRPTSAPRGPQPKITFTKDYRYTEHRIHEQEWVYALGWFETWHGPSLADRTTDRTKELLNEWKKNQAALLARFDRNGDGEIDMHEWEQARSAARAQADREIKSETAAPAINMMSRSALRDQPFVIATKEPRDMAKKYRRDAIISLVAGFAFSVFIYWRLHG